MERTPEQIEADDELTNAIEKVNLVYYNDVGRLVTDYVVVFAETWWESDGQQRTLACYFSRDGHQPEYKTMGLLEYALTRMRVRIAERES